MRVLCITSGERGHKEELTQGYKELFLPADGGERVRMTTQLTLTVLAYELRLFTVMISFILPESPMKVETQTQKN